MACLLPCPTLSTCHYSETPPIRLITARAKFSIGRPHAQLPPRLATDLVSVMVPIPICTQSLRPWAYPSHNRGYKTPATGGGFPWLYTHFTARAVQNCGSPQPLGSLVLTLPLQKSYTMDTPLSPFPLSPNARHEAARRLPPPPAQPFRAPVPAPLPTHPLGEIDSPMQIVQSGDQHHSPRSHSSIAGPSPAYAPRVVKIGEACGRGRGVEYCIAPLAPPCRPRPLCRQTPGPR